MPNINVSRTPGVFFTTTDGNTLNAATFATRSDTAYQLIVRIIAIKIDNLLGGADTYGAVASYNLAATFINDGGTLVQAAGTTNIFTHEEGDTGAYGADITPSGTNILVRVSGTAAQRVRWIVDADIREVGVNSLVPN